MTPWSQPYDPLHAPILSTLVAALPLLLLLGSIAFLRWKIHVAVAVTLAVALAVAIGVYGMPTASAVSAAGYGAAFGLFPIGWLVLNILFLYQLTVERGLFPTLRDSLAAVAPDPRVQLVLIAFCFGAFLEGMAGFGAPVAITAAILIRLGFSPLHACGLALIANTAPVAFGSLGIPITTLEQVSGLDALAVSAMVGRQLPLFSVIVPAWLVVAYAGWGGLGKVWPVVLAAGFGFAIPQALVSNLHGPWLVDIVAGGCSIGVTVLVARRFRGRLGSGQPPTPPAALTRRAVARAWFPWILLTVIILGWGLPSTKRMLDGWWAPQVPVPSLHRLVQRQPPVAPFGAPPESAVFRLNALSATGTGILVAALLTGAALRFPARELGRIYVRTVWNARFSLLTIAGMLSLGHVTKYSGVDATLGVALAQTGALYPFCGTLLGWLGVALTGSDTASNVLFGSLQRISAEQLGVSPILMGAANSSGGVMGKMIDAQSIVVASTATGWFGHEGSILRFVFWHSVALAMLVALWVTLQAYVPPFTRLVVGAP